MSTNWFNSNKTSNYIVVLLSLLLHIALITAFFFIKPLDKTPEKKKTFDLVELQMGKPQTVEPLVPSKQQPPKPNSAPQKKQIENNQTIKEPLSQTVVPIDSSPKIDSVGKNQPPGENSTNTTAEVNSSPLPSISAAVVPIQKGSEIGTVDAGVLGIKPVKVFGPDPVYPTIAQDLGITGTVKALLTIDASGAVKDVVIDKSPHKSMSEEVTRTLLKWKFKPVEYKGAHVIIKRFIQEVEFKAED
jgi:TonB family protein